MSKGFETGRSIQCRLRMPHRDPCHRSTIHLVRGLISTRGSPSRWQSASNLRLHRTIRSATIRLAQHRPIQHRRPTTHLDRAEPSPTRHRPRTIRLATRVPFGGPSKRTYRNMENPQADSDSGSAFLLVCFEEILVHYLWRDRKNHFREFPLGLTLLGIGPTLPNDGVRTENPGRRARGDR